MLTWLESQLAKAEQSHEKVWLMFHVPPGIDGWATTHRKDGTTMSCASSIVPMWVPEWTERFEGVLARYQDTVLASFAGHTHADDFRVMGAHSAKPQFVLIDSAISPIYDQNPGFRIVDFRSDGTLADQTVYYLTNLKQAGGKSPGHWKQEYRFSQRWRVPQLDGPSVVKIYDEIASRDKARSQWWRFYMVSSSAASISARDVKGLSCAIEGLTPEGYESCFCGLVQPSGQTR